MRVLVLACMLLTGCGSRAVVNLPSDQLRGLQAALASQLRTQSNEHVSGWPSDSDCDAALWAGEARAAGATWSDVSAALQSDGRPTRKPHADCGPAGTPGVGAVGNSEGTTSTDMQLGTILGLLAARDEASLGRLQQYAKDHGGVVGTPASDIPLTYMKPGTRTLLAQSVQLLGGTGDAPWLSLPILYGDPTADYQVHLEMISLLIEQKVSTFGAIDRAIASHACITYPADALVQVVCGNQTAAAAIALTPGWTAPSYVRGSPNYSIVYKLFVVHLLLGQFG